MAERIEGSPSALDQLTEELRASVMPLAEAADEYRQALAAFRSAEPNDLGGPALPDLAAEIDHSLTVLEKLDIVPRTFAHGLRQADEFARAAGTAAWDWAADRFTDPFFVGGNIALGLGLGIPAAVGKWATMPTPPEIVAHSDWVEHLPRGREWASRGAARLPGGAAGWHRAGQIARRVGGPTGVALSGVGRAVDDLDDPSLTGGDRIARTGGAMATEGLGGLGGAAVGAKIGVAIGTLGGPVGMAVGGVVGGIAGGIAGSELGGVAFDAMEGVWDSAGDGLDEFGGALGDLGSDAMETGGDLVDGALETGGDVLDSAGDAVSGLLGG